MDTAIQLWIINNVILVDFFHNANQFLIQVETNCKTSQTRWGADILSQAELQKILLRIKDDLAHLET